MIVAIVALTIIAVLQQRALISERQEFSKQSQLLMTRIQAPELAPALVDLPPEDEQASQWQSEEVQEKVWADANGTDFLEQVRGLNGDR